MLNTVGRDFSGVSVAPCNPLQRGFAFEGNNLGIEMKLNVRILRQTLSQVSRHGARQFACPHQQVYVAGSLRQEPRSLPRRVSSTDHRYLLTFRPLRFDASRSIVNSVALKPC